MAGRLLRATLGDSFSNLALEEALFDGLTVPTLRVWDNQRSVVIGRAQLAEFETDLERCRADSVPVVRRFTAGGAVYNGPGNLNWSFFVPKLGTRYEGKLHDAKGVFEAFADVVVAALVQCGVACDFRPPNGIVSKEGKISGMAAYVARDKVLCHGTLLVSADLRAVESLTTPSPRQLDRKYPRSRRTKVANCGVEPDEFCQRLCEVSDLQLEEGALDKFELGTASRLVETKYSRDGWNLGDPFSLDYL